MTDQPPGPAAPGPLRPALGPAGLPPRRMRSSIRARWVVAGVVAVVGASLALDFGHSANRADRGSDLKALVSQVNTDVASCNSSVADSFTAYREVIGGRADERSAAEKIAADDEQYCTPVGNTDLYDLATLEVPGTLKAYNLQAALGQVVSWAYPNGAAAIDDIGRMLASSANTGARQDLQSRLAAMRQLAASADRSFSVAAAALGVTVNSFDIRAANGFGG